MPRLPNLAGYSFDELQTLLSAANKRMDEIRAKRVKEVQAELNMLGEDGGASVSRRGRKSATTRSGTRAAQKASIGRATPVQFEGRMARNIRGEALSPGGRGI